MTLPYALSLKPRESEALLQATGKRCVVCVYNCAAHLQQCIALQAIAASR